MANLCGQFDEHLHQIEKRLGVRISHRGSNLQVSGDALLVDTSLTIINKLHQLADKAPLSPADVHLFLQEANLESLHHHEKQAPEIEICTRRGKVKARGKNQHEYLQNILSHDINFGIGPAGTGKTYLAVACAVEALEKDQIRRLLLTRPAVEAGERLGFLPGDLSQKIDPYLRPLYDALYEMLGFERVNKLIERNVIEVAPLAYMRGRTLNESFIILDEAQNTTTEQMKMFLTRIGFNSTAVITGDITQVDLPYRTESGLKHTIKVLKEVKDIGFTFFQAKDVVRHALVQKIVTAYDSYERQTATTNTNANTNNTDS